MFSLSPHEPGTYSMPIKEWREPRAKPLFSKGTIHYAIETADFKEIDRLCLEGKENGYHESVTLQTKEDLLGMMPIHIAAERGLLDVVKFLIKKHVDLDAGDKFRVTALHLAAIENHEEVVKTLITAQADVKAVDRDGDMAIHWAATKGHTSIVSLLVKSGSPVDAVNSIGWTALHRAAYNGRKDTVIALVNAGASLSARNKDGNTPLHLACFMNQLSTVETLLGLCAKTDILNTASKRPLDLCITDAARDMVRAHTTNVGEDAGSARQATPKDKSTEPRAVIPAYDGDRRSAHMDTTKLSEAIRHKAKAAEFPDFDEQPSKGHEEEETSLYLRTSGGPPRPQGAAFLSEVSAGFDDTKNPYALGYQNSSMIEDDRSSVGSRRTSRASFGERLSHRASVGAAGARSLGAPQGSTSGGARERTSPSAVNTPRSLQSSGSLAKRASVATATPIGGVLSPRASSKHGSGPLTGSGSLKTRVSNVSTGLSGWDGIDRLSADDYQQRVKEENRKAAAAAGAAGLLAGAGAAPLGGPATSGPAHRPSSGNKKFLEKYNLNQFSLFAP